MHLTVVSYKIQMYCS